MAEDAPSAPFVTQANFEKIRRAFFLHFGHTAFSSALADGRMSSNTPPHSGHEYSYIGICKSNPKIWGCSLPFLLSQCQTK
jgi:hypothetical protein